MAARSPRKFRSLVTRLAQRTERWRTSPTPSQPPRPSAGAPLDTVNDAFHATYAEARTHAKQDGPVFVVLSDDLIVFRGASRQCFSFSPRAFHVIKSVAHAPVALFARYERPPPPTEAELLLLRARVTSARAYVTERASELAQDTREELAHVLRACEALLADLRGGGDRTQLEAFARSTGPSLLRLAREATRVQLGGLHAHTERALRELSPEERAALHVVVAGDHQARVRSLVMQYFKKRFGEPAGTELHVSYAEGVHAPQAALELVGTQRLDRRLALAFFGEATRLQRDILGDAAQELLSTVELEPIA